MARPDRNSVARRVLSVVTNEDLAHFSQIGAIVEIALDTTSNWSEHLKYLRDDSTNCSSGAGLGRMNRTLRVIAGR